MSTRIRNVDPTRSTRTIIASGQTVAHDAVVEVEDELGASLLRQKSVWALAVDEKQVKGPVEKLPNKIEEKA